MTQDQKQHALMDEAIASASLAYKKGKEDGMTEEAVGCAEHCASTRVDLLIAVNEWLLERGDISVAKELNDAMCKKFGINPNNHYLHADH